MKPDLLSNNKNKTAFVMVALCVIWAQSVVGQDSTNKWQFKGNLGLYGDFYSMTSDTAGAITSRRPGSVGRLLVNSTLTYGEFSVPISLMLSVGQKSKILPSHGSQNFIEFIKDPSNRIGIAPKYKWAQLLLGTQLPQYSELSVGDLPQFGAGINLTPGLFRFSCFAGTTQLAIEEDTTKNIQGVYARKMYSAKIGYGKEEASHVYLIGTLMKDDTTSLKTNPMNTMPQNGLLSSLDYRIKISKQVYLKGEVAASVFTRDSRSKLTSDENTTISLPPAIFKAQESSRLNYASILSITKEGKIFGIKLKGKYIGDGFVPLGYPFMQNDVLDLTINPRFNLFKDKLQFSFSYGKRFNNLSGARSATTTQTLMSADFNLQLTQGLSFTASFSNFDFRNSITSDTLKVQMSTFSLGVSPSYTYIGTNNMHVLTLLYSKNIFTDYNTVSGEMNDNNSQNVLLTYLLANLSTPFNMSTTYSYFDNHSFFGLLTTKSANVSFGYKFLKNKLNTIVGLTYATNKLESLSPSAQIFTSLRLKYSLSKKLNVSAYDSINLFTYGSERPGISYQENLLRLSLTYKF